MPPPCFQRDDWLAAAIHRLALRDGQEYANDEGPGSTTPTVQASVCTAVRSTTYANMARSRPSRCSKQPATPAYINEAKALVGVLDGPFSPIARAAAISSPPTMAADLIVRAQALPR